MDTQETILHAYHRAVARHLQKTGESYPLVRKNCVFEDEGVICSTSMERLATFTLDAQDRPRIRLI